MRRRISFSTMLFAALLLIFVAGCDDHHYDDGLGHHGNRTWTVSVENETHEILDVYLDGQFLASLAPDTSVETVDIEGHHRLVAYDLDGLEVASRSFLLDAHFVWILEN